MILCLQYNFVVFWDGTFVMRIGELEAADNFLFLVYESGADLVILIGE